MKYLAICSGLAALLATSALPVASGAAVEQANVIWTTPSKDAAGSMPLGNGELGINLWVEENGDLLFYLSRTDSYSELGRLLKVGRVRVSLSPNPFVAGAPFRQELKLREGVCEIAAGKDSGQVHLKVFVDSDRPVVHVIGQSQTDLTVRATVESWRNARHVLAKGDEQFSIWILKDAPLELTESADVFPSTPSGAVAWYHRNEESTGFTSTIKHQSLESIAGKVRDPLLHRTFGGWMTGDGFTAADDGRAIQTGAPTKPFALRVAVPCLQTPTAQEWMESAQKLAADSSSASDALTRTTAWWENFWERSWVDVTETPESSPVANAHPLRIGHDSEKQNHFPGTIGRTSIFNQVLAPEEIAGLASSPQGQPALVKDGLVISGDGTPREIANEQIQIPSNLTLEAWIKPERNQPGRIFDKSTVGKSDGFLLDTHPGDSLRLMFGEAVLSTPGGTLKIGEWQHVAASADGVTGALRLYVNGKQVAEKSGTPKSSVTQCYTLQRYMQACGGRGNLPILFNGGIFTVEPKALGKPFNPDWRSWGGAYWYQNTRHMYHPMLATGDFDLMRPFFRMYESARPLCEARAKLYHGTEGCYFPETMAFWGTYGNGDYGWERSNQTPDVVATPYIRYIWSPGLELVALMLDYWDYTGDEAFLRNELLPMAVSVLKYFESRFQKDADGKLVITPSQAVESYFAPVTNDMPTVAGLKAITSRLCAIQGKKIPAENLAFFARMKAACPDLPLNEGRLGPAQQHGPKHGMFEKPQLYAVWPFRLFGVGLPDLEMARDTFAHRSDNADTGWGYDGNIAAVLGLTKDAVRILKAKCANSNPAYRWPASWGPNFDGLPDQNHGGNLLNTTNLMLLQGVGEKIHLLPAWPKDWDVSFKLHAPLNTIVECEYRAGKVVTLKVTPEARSKDVVICTDNPQP